MAEERLHSTLAPSASGRWMNCAGSIEANAKGGRSSVYAEQGTAAHELFELCLTADVDPEKFLGTCIYKDFEVDDDMAEAVGLALDWVRAYLAKHPTAKLYSDKRVDPASLLKCEKGLASGTLDVGIDNKPVELVLIDYKHGAGVVVEAEDNSQLLQYTLGFVAQYATQPYEGYRLVIIQPRARHESGPVREVVLTHDELMAYADKLRKRIKEIKRKPDERKAGSWCTFCAGAGKCRTLTEHNLLTARIEFGELEEPVNPKELSPKELAYVMSRLPLLEKWMHAVYAAALNLMLKGKELPDHKLVYGRSVRSWSDEKKVMALLEKGKFDIDEYAPRDLIGVGKVVVMLKKRIAEKGVKQRKVKQDMLDKAWQHFKPLVHNSQPPIHVAPASDPRPAVKRGQEFERAEPLPEDKPARKGKRK